MEARIGAEKFSLIERSKDMERFAGICAIN